MIDTERPRWAHRGQSVVQANVRRLDHHSPCIVHCAHPPQQVWTIPRAIAGGGGTHTVGLVPRTPAQGSMCTSEISSRAYDSRWRTKVGRTGRVLTRSRSRQKSGLHSLSTRSNPIDRCRRELHQQRLSVSPLKQPCPVGGGCWITERGSQCNHHALPRPNPIHEDSGGNR